MADICMAATFSAAIERGEEDLASSGHASRDEGHCPNHKCLWTHPRDGAIRAVLNCNNISCSHRIWRCEGGREAIQLCAALRRRVAAAFFADADRASFGR